MFDFFGALVLESLASSLSRTVFSFDMILREVMLLSQEERDFGEFG